MDKVVHVTTRLQAGWSRNHGFISNRQQLFLL